MTIKMYNEIELKDIFGVPVFYKVISILFRLSLLTLQVLIPDQIIEYLSQIDINTVQAAFK